LFAFLVKGKVTRTDTPQGCACAGDAANADPVCDKSPLHHRVLEAVTYAQTPDDQRSVLKPLVFRDPKNSKLPTAAS